MTRPKVSRYPVSSFGPELMAILLKGSRERVEIPCPDQRTMRHLQMRLQMLRGAMGREKHPQYTLVTRARTSRTWDAAVGVNERCVLVVQPNDSQFAPALKSAGIAVTDNERDILDNVPESPTGPPTVPDIIDDVTPVNPYDKFK